MSLYGSLAVTPAQNGKVFKTGSLTPGSADVEVVTGLSAIDHCGVSLGAVPSSTHSISICGAHSNAGSIRIRSYEADHTIAVTPVTVNWWALGDR